MTSIQKTRALCPRGYTDRLQPIPILEPLEVPRARLNISVRSHGEYYCCEARETYLKADTVRALPNVRSETEREVHGQHRTSLRQDSSRPRLGCGEACPPRKLK